MDEETSGNNASQAEDMEQVWPEKSKSDIAAAIAKPHKLVAATEEEMQGTPEIKTAGNFIAYLIAIMNPDRKAKEIGTFISYMIKALSEFYKGHWYEKRPQLGQGFRAVEISGSTVDRKVCLALAKSNLENIKLPYEVTIFIDPKCTAYRFGANGSIDDLYIEGKTVWRPESNIVVGGERIQFVT